MQVAVARRALELTGSLKSEWPIVLSTVLVGILLIVIDFAISFSPEYRDTEEAPKLMLALFIVLWFGIVGSLVSFAIYVAFASIAGFMLVHRVAWPLASRLLYSLQRHKIVQRKKALNAIGAAFLGVAIPGVKGWQTFLKLIGDLLSQA